MSRNLFRTGLAVSMVVSTLISTGCNRAPSVDVLGSFFPVWMVCVIIAVVLVSLLRILMVRLKLEPEVGPLALFYPSAVILFAGLLWLIFFR